MARLIAACLIWLAAFGVRTVDAAQSPPAMIVPGQFDVSATGAATYTIPIAVPPGTAGMVPALSLEYSSQSGDGIEGIGWTLSGLPSISRCPRTLAQDGVHGSVNYDTNDRFCMDGQRLMYVTGGSGYGTDSSQYRTELEGFSKIIEHGAINGSSTYFEVWTKSGQHMWFGNTPDSAVLTVGLSTNVIRAWAVNKISDTVGNYLTVTYNCADAGSGCTDRTVNGEAYPVEIDYTGHDGSPTISPYNSVKFSYCSRDTTPVCTRADSVPIYQAGATTQSTVLLWDIQTYQGANLVYDYKLDYRRGTTTTHSRLTSVTLCGATSCLAPTTFNWQGGPGYLTPNTPVTTASSTLGQTIYPGDFNGDGLTDVAITTPGFFTDCDTSIPYYYGSHSVGFSPTADGTVPIPTAGAISCTITSPSVTTVAPDGNSQIVIPIFATFCTHPDCVPPGTHSQSSVTVFTSGLPSILWKNNVFTGTAPANYLPGDFNGDGLVDFFQQNSGTSYGYISNSLGFFNQDGGHSGIGIGAASLAAGDFDGDGCADLLALGGSSNNVDFLFCNPAVSTMPAPSITGFNVTLGDFNGDGKVDILLTANGTPGQLWLSKGSESGGTGFVEVNSSLPSDWGKYSIRVGDWNGDGKADIILVAAGGSGQYGSGTTHKLFVSTGTGFTAAVDGSGTPVEIPNSATNANATIADWNNDGASDVWIQQAVVSGVGDTFYTYAYVPELITGVSNGIGSTTNVTYAPLNQNGTFYSSSTGTSYPSQNVNGAVYAVSQVDASNGLGTCTPPSTTNCYTSTYAYTGAKVNLTGRGFLGFSSVTITDAQTGIVQTTNYHTDDCDVPAGLSALYLECPLVGLIASQTKVCPGATAPCGSTAVTLNSTANTYTATNLGGTSNLVTLTQSVVASNDLNGATMPGVTTNYTYDSYGNALTVNVAVSDGSSKSTTNTYINDTTNWFLGRLQRTVVQSIVGASNLTRQSCFAYDSSTGLLNLEIIEPDPTTCSTSTASLGTSYTYDPFGHRITTTVYGSGITTRTSYAFYDAIGQFQTSAANALGQYEFWGYDARFGGPTSHTGPNFLTTSWSYDSFGRMTQEIRPDSTQTKQSYGYCSGGCPTYGQFFAQGEIFAPDGVTQAGPIATAYYDMLSRGIANDNQGFNGSNIRVATIYDGNGRVQQTSRPYFTASASPAWTVFTYDALGRVTKATFPDSSYSTYSFNGLTTSTTNSLSQTTTTVKNAQGLNYQITDATSHTTTYVYDAFGNLVTVTDPLGNVVTNTYDIRGNKTASSDPDMGSWTYTYDVLSEILSQTDAKSQISSLTYDVLGRALTRSEPGLYSAWTYGALASNHNIGQIIEAKACTASSCSTLVSDKTYAYDGLSRQAAYVLQTPTDYFSYRTAYNSSNGQIASVAYPSGYMVNRTYNGQGFLTRMTGATGELIWAVNARDAELHLTSQTAGNGVVTTQAFDPLTGRIENQRAGPGGSVASFDYGIDTIGNLYSRADNNEGFIERFCYDSLNRLTQFNIGSACSGGKTASYDAIGNITAKSDVGTYSYPASGASSVRPHAVSSITGTVDGLANPLYSYDGNGNLTCVSAGGSCTVTVGRQVTLTSFNMAASVTQGGDSIALSYDDQHQRLQQASTASGITTTTVYLNDAGNGAMSERVATGTALPTFVDYITLDGQIVAQRSVQYAGSPAWGSANWGAFTWGPAAPLGAAWGGFNWGAVNWSTGSAWGHFLWGGAAWSGPVVNWAYFNLDHLGSVAVITDGSGAVIQRLSYDPWGRQRNANATDTPCGTIASATTRGFTNQEQMSGGCTINLNARLYDPTIGKFMAADPVVGDPMAPNAFNRYSYVLNNPLSFTDTTGLCFLGCFWKSSVFSAVLDIALVAVGLPELEGFNVFAEGFQLSSIGIGLSVANAGIAGGITSGISGGNILKGAAFGALSAGLAAGPGGALSQSLGSVVGTTAGNFIGQGLAGGIASQVENGNFGSGFLAAGFGSFSPSGGAFSTGYLVESAVLGGVGSTLGGGKFANGAVTGAFAYAASADYGPTAAGSGPSLQLPPLTAIPGSPFSFTWAPWCSDIFCGPGIVIQYGGSAPIAHWFQSYSANSASAYENGSWQIDDKLYEGGPPNSGAPFYTSPQTGGSKFSDAPSDYSTNSRSFTAQTSVVDSANHVLATVTWGYTYTPGAGAAGVKFSAPVPTSSSQNQGLINSGGR